MFIMFPQLIHANPWEEYLNEEQRIFCKKQMEPVLELYHQGREEEALEELEQAYQRAEATYELVKRDRVHIFHRIIWWEAQVRSGRENQEWGCKLYEYLFIRDCLNHGSISKISSNDFILFGNIIGCLDEIGKAAESRAWILKIEDSIGNDWGLNTTNMTCYADEGALFDFMPEARKRAFPLYRHQVAELKTCKCTSHPIYYAYLYGIQHIANEALKAGDWARAAELYQWFLSYTDMYIEGEKNSKRGEVFKYSLCAIASIARICDLHGHPEEVLPMYEKAITQAKKYFGSKRSTLQIALIRYEATKVNLGTMTEESLAIADQAVAEISVNHYFSPSEVLEYKLLRARIYHALGRKADAWEMVNTLQEECTTNVNPYLWTYLLTTMIDLAIDDGATHPKLEDWLILALQTERLKGNKFGELPLYEKYAIFLTQHGRYTEAITIQQEAIRLAKSMNLLERTEKNLNTLNHLHNLLPSKDTHTGENEPAVPETESTVAILPPNSPTKAISTTETSMNMTRGITSTSSKKPSAIDIQPYQSTAIALADQPAYGRFYLFNPTAQTQHGLIRISGALDNVMWLQDTWISLGSSPELPSTEIEEPLSISAGAYCVIDITGTPDKSGKKTTITYEWIPDDAQQKTTTASWEYRSATNDQRTAVIDAHAIRENPFYLIPIHHMIQRHDVGETERVDLTVKASATMRIELYNAETGELIFIDANGDGDFQDAGDFIGVDKNRNNWPDITFEADQKRISLVMYIKPAAHVKKIETELTINVLDHNEWRVDAVDLIKFAE